MKKIISLFVCFALMGCAFQTKHRGYVFPSDLEEQVSDVKTTAQLEQKFGSPMAKTMYGENYWVYYGVDENYHGPFPLSYDNKKVMIAKINGSRVAQIRILTGDQVPEVKMADGETKIPAAIELNAMEELFNNVGRFSPAGMGT